MHKCHEYYMLLTKLPVPHFPQLSISCFDSHKLSYTSIPKSCKFVAIAIADDIFHECSKFNDYKELLAIETYISYYMHKINTMKRKMKWYKSETPPELFVQKTNCLKTTKLSKELISKVNKRKMNQPSEEEISNYNKPKRQKYSVVRYENEFV